MWHKPTQDRAVWPVSAATPLGFATTHHTAEMSKEAEVEVPPEGTQTFLLTMKQMDKLGLKTGPRMSDVVPYAWIPLEDIQADLEFAGALSPWSPVKGALKLCI